MRSKLIDHHITTAEELLGQIEAVPADVSKLLDADQGFLDDLKVRVEAAIPDETVAAIEDQRGRDYPLGALPPDEKAS